MEDFYWLEDYVGGAAKGSGKIEVSGQTVNFDFEAYGACYIVNVEGTQYPEFCGGPGDWTTRGSNQQALPPDHPAVQAVDRIEALRQMPLEPNDDPIAQIATQVEVEGPLEDQDEFVDENVADFIHVINGRKVRMPDDANPDDYIKELPTPSATPGWKRTQ